MRRRRIEPYGFMKSILAEGMSVGGWWERTDWQSPANLTHLLNWFGRDAMRRGAEQALAEGESVPAEALAYVGLSKAPQQE